MSGELYEHVKTRAIEEFPGLARVLGPEEAGREMARVLFEQYGDVLYPYEINAIGTLAIEAAFEAQYHPSPYIEPDTRVGFDRDGNYHCPPTIPSNIILAEE